MVIWFAFLLKGMLMNATTILLYVCKSFESEEFVSPLDIQNAMVQDDFERVDLSEIRCVLDVMSFGKMLDDLGGFYTPVRKTYISQSKVISRDSMISESGPLWSM